MCLLSKFNYIIGGVIILELIVVSAFTALTYKVSATALKLMFIFYSFLNGITMSVFFLAYSQSSIIYAFAGTVVLFTILAIYGYVTREDLTKYFGRSKAISVLKETTSDELAKEIDAMLKYVESQPLDTVYYDMKGKSQLTWEAYGKRYSDFLKQI